MTVALMSKKGLDPTNGRFVKIGSSSDGFRAVVARTVDAGINPGSHLDVALHGPCVVHADIDVAGVIDGDAFAPGVGGGAGALLGRRRFRDEGGDLAVLHAADPHPAPEARVLRHVGFGVTDIEHVVLVDEQTARTSELVPLGEKRAVRAEYFDAIIRSIRNVYAAGRIDRHRMVDPELAGAGAALAPRRDELAVARELGDPGIGLAA